MNPRVKFNLAETPLARGQTLIEASAGTGKTYTIAGIVLRLVIEHGFEIDKILVTTYTELATAELRDRIRRLLRESLTAFEEGHSPNEFIERICLQKQELPQAKRRLELALQTFDQAAIYTIHGFCQRVLKDRAFESGTLFDAELITDESTILNEIVDDFWRRQFYAANPLLVAAAATHNLTPATLRRDLDDLIKKPTLEVRPAYDSAQEKLSAELIMTHWEAARSCWLRDQAAVRARFERLSWAKKAYSNPVEIASRFLELEVIFDPVAKLAGNGGAIVFFSSGQIAAGTRKQERPPEHEFFRICEALSEAGRSFARAIRAKFLASARSELVRRKVERNVLFYDDLLSRLHNSLGGSGGEALAESVRKRFHAVLVDEFQDTDPVQYAIFERIYAQSEAPVFLIGDPKQSIYGFRGADIFTYIQAAQKADYHYTLGYNWRSEAGLVDAINTVFGLSSDPFLLEGVSFAPVAAAGAADETPLTHDGKKSAPLELWLQEEEIKNKEEEQHLPAMLASEIVRVLSSNHTIGERRVAAQDLAILVGSNREAQTVQEALRARRVPSVIYGAASVFKSREAKELQLILAAVVEPGQEGKVRAALATEALGLTSEELVALAGEDQRWESILRQFQHYHELWKERGFIQMLRTVVTEQGVRSRLLSYVDGERRLTNLLHLGELLHRLCVEGQLGMSGLSKHLNELMLGNDLQSEEHELRLESDEKAVRVITVHKSKGLQYGIVYCPFAWRDPWVHREANVVFHDHGQVVLDLAAGEASVEAQKLERLQDQLRLFYVALTRAEHGCSMVWGNFRSGQKSAPAHLFGPWKSSEIRRLQGQRNIAMRSLPTISDQVYEAAAEAASSLRARRFERVLDRSYGIASFTRFLSEQIEEPAIPEDDAVETIAPDSPVVAEDSALEGIAAFPRGTAPGTCLHHIFEELDFTSRSELDSLVKSRLQAFGLIGFDQVVSEMVEKVLTVSLERAQPDLKLSNVGRSARLSELEFYFPLTQVTQEKLAQVFPDKRLRFHAVSGFMKGFIDLIFRNQDRFYIVDWKSNWLGPSPESYTQEAMDAEMESKFYHLQLSIYTIALHRLLKARLPGYSYETHFGGVFYLFLRGIEPSRPELGVWRTRLKANFVEHLDEIFGHDS